MTFQLALIPGSLLAGFLLSPLLYLSRHLAQRPAHRLRFPHEKPVHRRLLALGFYGGSAIVCGGLVGTWTRWCLGWRDPWIWVVCWLFDGPHRWTRPALISYWGALAAISVAGWSRQLSRARRHRRYVVPGVRESVASGTTEGLGGVASQMMDAADSRMPTLSVNARRKFFHALAVVMFVPGIAVDVGYCERRSSCKLTCSLRSPICRSASRSQLSTSPNTCDISLCGPSASASISS